MKTVSEWIDLNAISEVPLHPGQVLIIDRPITAKEINAIQKGFSTPAPTPPQ